MRRGACVVTVRKHRREPLVVRLDGRSDHVAQPRDERFGGASLLAALAAERQRHADEHEIRLLRLDHGEELGKPRLGADPFNGRHWAGKGTGRVGDRDPGARGAVVERQDLQASAAASLSRPASSASRTAPTFLPPASASVARPPPPPPLIGPRSRTILTASISANALSRFTTRATLPSSVDASTTADASSRRRT